MNNYNIRKEQKRTTIELSKKNIVLRVVFFFVFLIIGLLLIFNGIKACYSEGKGWSQINATDSIPLDDEITLFYNIGQDNSNPVQEKKELTVLYTSLINKCYTEFNEYVEFENIKNIFYINNHPNEEIFIDPLLYNTLKEITKNNRRYLYYGPYMYYYNNLFLQSEDDNAKEIDPNKSAEQQSHFNELSAYINNNTKINLEFYDNYKIKLFVSESYIEYLNDYSINMFLSLGLFKNSFVVDYLKDELLLRDFKNGYIISSDGFLSNLSEISLTNNIYKLENQSVEVIKQYEQRGPYSSVTLNTFPVNSSQEKYYYIYNDGTISSALIDKNGLNHKPVNSLISYSNNLSCSAILLKIYDIFSYDTLNINIINDMEYIYILNGEIFSSSTLE